nr:MAG TPA: REase AHJR-like protein [Caudoviricetes sp.]
MSKAVPHFSQEWLEEYRKRLGNVQKATQKAPQKPVKARPSPAPALVPYSPVESVAVPFRAAGGKQTKTEEKYNRECLAGRGRFEAVTLHLPGGGRYTPDFMTVDDGVVTFHEVKGSYRLGSQGRAYTAFHDAAAYYPMWRFVWSHWTGKAWERKTLPEIRI